MNEVPVGSVAVFGRVLAPGRKEETERGSEVSESRMGRIETPLLFFLSPSSRSHSHRRNPKAIFELYASDGERREKRRIGSTDDSSLFEELSSSRGRVERDEVYVKENEIESVSRSPRCISKRMAEMRRRKERRTNKARREHLG